MPTNLGAVVEPVPVEVEYDRVVREDIELFRAKAAEFLAGKLTDDEFRPFRLRRGIYGQRQPGVQMVRTKVPGGMVTAGQMRQLARVAGEFAGGKAHLTTRQNVQFHFVPLSGVADLLHLLADVRLTTREACYNTVRNVTCCPLAGLLPEEPFDVRPYARRLAFAFLHKDLTDNLPRKFKICFSACSEDCIGAGINDIGLRAAVRQENGVMRRGFRMLAGGGLGSLPSEARMLDEFVPEDQLIQKCEALIRVFNKHGNRANKMKARLKFVIRERGFEWLKDAVETEYADILANGGIDPPESVPEGFGGFESDPREPRPVRLPLAEEAPNGDSGYTRWVASNVRRQKQTGYASVTARVDRGNLTGGQMRDLARISEEEADGKLRFTMDQNVVLAFVPLDRLRTVRYRLRAAGLGEAGAGEIGDVTTCPGAYSCNLGLTKSMSLGAALSEAVESRAHPEVRKLSIKISGCPNSCGQHWTADIGFYGNARKVNGREVPYYMLLLGGGHDEHGATRFGLGIQSIPARLAREAVDRVLDHYEANRTAGETFRQYVLRHKVEFFRELTSDLAKPAELYPEMYKDWGDEDDFSLKMGRGECAA